MCQCKFQLTRFLDWTFLPKCELRKMSRIDLKETECIEALGLSKTHQILHHRVLFHVIAGQGMRAAGILGIIIDLNG